MSHIATSEEINDTLMSIPSNKTSAPDGFNGKFFRFNWDMIDAALIAVVNQFLIIDRIFSLYFALQPEF